MSAPQSKGGGASQTGSVRPEGSEVRAALAHVRHELRTSLTAVMGYAEFLLDNVSRGGPQAMEKPLE